MDSVISLICSSIKAIDYFGFILREDTKKRDLLKKEESELLVAGFATSRPDMAKHFVCLSLFRIGILSMYLSFANQQSTYIID